MSGEWLKFEKATLDKPEVLAVAAALGWDADLAVGKFVRMWSWFDTHTVDGDARGVTPALLDSILRVTGFASEVQKVGWLEVHEWGIRLPRFDVHCGETAKKRALGAKRNAAYRASNAKGDAHSVTSASPREEKKREEKKKDQKILGHRHDDRDRFESKFWPAYPRHVAKASAAKAFAKINPDDALLTRMLAALAVHVASEQWRRDDGRYIPHPATWLNQSRWEDETGSPAAFDPASCADGAVL